MSLSRVFVNIIILTLSLKSSNALKPPVLIVPGLGGSGLYAKLENANVPGCSATSSTTDWYRVWLTVMSMMPPDDNRLCWASVMSLVPPTLRDENGKCLSVKKSFVELTDLYSPTLCDGVTVDAAKDRRLKEIEYLDYFGIVPFFLTSYMRNMVKVFENAGYTRDVDLLAFPYDWRRPFSSIVLLQLKWAIEHAYATNHGQKVALIGHNLGANLITGFLNSNHVTQTWKDKYISKFVSIAGAYEGTVKNVLGLLNGALNQLDFGISSIKTNLVPTECIGQVFRSVPLLLTFLPLNKATDQTMIRVTTKKYEAIRKSKDKWPVTCEGRLHMKAFAENVDKAATYNKEESSEYETENDDSVTSLSLFQRIKNTLIDVYSHIFPYRLFKMYLWNYWFEHRSPEGFENEFNDQITHEYTLHNFTDLLPRDYECIVKAWVENQNYEEMFKDPQVPTYCIWSRLDEPTTDVAYNFKSSNLNLFPDKIDVTYGDGMISVESASVCKNWASSVESKEFKNVAHGQMLSDDEVNKQLVEFVSHPPANQ